MYARRWLTLFLLPSLLAAGACADRAENATGRGALDRQLDRAFQSDSNAALAAAPARLQAAVPADAPGTQPAPTQPAARPAPEAPQAPASAAQPSAVKHDTAQPAAAQPAAAERPSRQLAGQGAAAGEPVPVPESTPRAAAGVAQSPDAPVERPSAPAAEGVDSAAAATTPVPRAREPRTVTMMVPIGAMLDVSLDQQLSTQENRAGDAFSTTLSEPYRDASGTVLLPAGAVLEGRVTASQQSTRVGRTAVLKLAFESIRFGGRSYPLSATVMEANPERRSRSNTAGTAGKIAAGAAAGALLGRILGKDTKSTVAGAAMGAAAGTAIALGTQDVDAVLPKDSHMVVRVDEPVSVEVVVR